MTRAVWLISMACTMYALTGGPASAQPAVITYQGELKAQGERFTGPAKMKFAIVRDNLSLWSNDSTSAGGQEPSKSVDVAVTKGFFSVPLGAPPMWPITPAILANAAGAKLRVWVSTTGAFERLSDQDLTSVPFALQGSSGPSDSSWSRSGDNVFRLTGRVGIGTDNPTNVLDVLGGAAFQGNHLYLRNRDAPPDSQTWGFVVNKNAGYLAIGPATDIPPSGGVLQATVVRLTAGAPDNSLTIDDAGLTSVKVLRITGGSDLAEPFQIRQQDRDAAELGMIVSIDPADPGALRLATKPYDRLVVGVLSGANGLSPGVVMRADDQSALHGRNNVALSGRVFVHATTINGSIEPGDLLTSSAKSGFAMKAIDPARSHGAVIGKAMTTLKSGTGYVLLLVQPQ